MFPIPHRSRQLTMMTHGDATAWGLCDAHTGNAEKGTGWWGALQAAADLSGNDPEILRLADEIHIFAPTLRSPGRLYAYVHATQGTAVGASARAFLRGMVLHLDSTHELDD